MIPPGGRKYCYRVLVALCVCAPLVLIRRRLGRDVFTDRLVRMCVCLLVFGCCVSMRGAWLSLYELYISPKVHLYRSHASSAERVRFCSALVVYPKELAARALGCILY